MAESAVEVTSEKQSEEHEDLHCDPVKVTQKDYLSDPCM